MAYRVAVHAPAIAPRPAHMPFAPTGSLLLDFSSSNAVQTFWVINDGVMGGVSTSRRRSTGGAMVFDGELSLKNGGGFASLRGPIKFPTESAALLLTVRGDGKRYKLILKRDDSSSTAQFQAVFVAPREWKTLRFEPPDFKASFRGYAVAAPSVRLADVQYVGLLISDKQSGKFQVELKDIRAE